MLTVKTLLSSLALFLTLNLHAQHVLNGKVIDAQTKEPLAGASVYCQNTTVGTTTNKSGNFSLELKPGGYDLVVSFTGYQTKQRRVNSGDIMVPDMELEKEEKNLGEVVVKTSSEVKDGWEKYGGFFIDHLIGTTPNAKQAKLLNPEVLKFYSLKRSNKLRVLATEPLQIENHALGYVMRYQLDSFIYSYNDKINSYRGYCFYTEMEGTDSSRLVWAKNRERAYFGSRLHFMRSYYDSTLTEDGWWVSLLDEKDDKKFNRLENVYDSIYYGIVPLDSAATDSTMQIEVWFPRKFSVTYHKSRPDPEYLKQFKMPADVPNQISYIDLKDAIIIQENGYYYDQQSWINQGYWSWKNLGDQLPYDYVQPTYTIVPGR